MSAETLKNETAVEPAKVVVTPKQPTVGEVLQKIQIDSSRQPKTYLDETVAPDGGE